MKTRSTSRAAATRGAVLRAFTLIEVLVVVTVIAIAGAIVVPQMLKAGTLQIQAGGRMVIADLLYAQNEAIAQAAVRRVVFDPAQNRYRLTDGSGVALQASWRSGGSNTADYSVDFNRDTRFSGVKLSAADFGGTQTIEFDALGTPSAGGTVDLTAGNVHYRIAVAPFTGRVTIAPASGN
jgi:prepilin-type N-terminal cleavage/methylation domain-containing protein